jgi:hypothetical protein
VIAAIVGTREGAAAGGYRLTSTGVTWTDPAEVGAPRDAIASHDVGSVMLVAPLLAAAALAQTVGDALGYEHIAMLFVERDSATLAVVEIADGSIVDLHRQPLSGGPEKDIAGELAAMVGGLDAPGSPADGVFVVGCGAGCGADVVAIKAALDAATALAVIVPEEPDTALARGAAVASANAPLFPSSTAALAYSEDPGTGEVNPRAVCHLPRRRRQRRPGRRCARLQLPARRDGPRRPRRASAWALRADRQRAGGDLGRRGGGGGGLADVGCPSGAAPAAGPARRRPNEPGAASAGAVACPQPGAARAGTREGRPAGARGRGRRPGRTARAAAGGAAGAAQSRGHDARGAAPSRTHAASAGVGAGPRAGAGSGRPAACAGRPAAGAARGARTSAAVPAVPAAPADDVPALPVLHGADSDQPTAAGPAATRPVGRGEGSMAEAVG